MRFLAAYLVPICILTFVVWQSWKVLSVKVRSNRRIKRMKALEAIVTSTRLTSEERRAAMDELLDMGLNQR